MRKSEKRKQAGAGRRGGWEGETVRREEDEKVRR